MDERDLVTVDLDIRNVRGVHTGGRMQDPGDWSEDVDAPPTIFMKDGSSHEVSVEAALAVEVRLVKRQENDMSDTPSG